MSDVRVRIDGPVADVSRVAQEFLRASRKFGGHVLSSVARSTSAGQQRRIARLGFYFPLQRGYKDFLGNYLAKVAQEIVAGKRQYALLGIHASRDAANFHVRIPVKKKAISTKRPKRRNWTPKVIDNNGARQ